MPTDEKPGATGMADRVEIDTPGEVRGHSMSTSAVSSSLVSRWKSARAAAGDKRLSRVDLAVHLVILDHMNNASGEAWPSADTVAREVDATTRAIRSSRHRLVSFGYLTETNVIGKPNRYKVGTPEPRFTPEAAFTPELQSTPPLNCSSATPEAQFRGPLKPSSPELALKHLVEEPTKEPKKKRSSASRPADSDQADESFVRFWKAYPRKDSKDDGEKAWRQVKGAQHIDAILADIAKRLADPHQWTERQFTPMPATYLRKRRWLDEWQPQTITDRVRKSAEDFGNYDFGKSRAGRVSVPSEQQADAMNAKAAARLAKSRPSVTDSFEGKVYVGTPDHELPDWLKDEATP